VWSALAATVPIAVGVFTFWQVWLRWRAHGTAEARRLIAEARDTFGEVIAHGYLEPRKWLTPERRATETGLDDLLGQLRDGKLRRECADLLSHWKRAFASAPQAIVGVGVLGGPMVTNDSPERRKQVEVQLAAAHEGIAAALNVRSRCDRLERRIVWR
jgi:hypothetical protein